MIRTTTRIIEHADHDCDGIGYSFHRIRVPIKVAAKGSDAVYSYAVASEQMSGYYDGAFVLDAADAAEFRRAMAAGECTGSREDADPEFHQRYWLEVGYYSEFHRR